jgi:RNA-directed DNA polymerase
MWNACLHWRGEKNGKFSPGGSASARACITPISEDYAQKEACRKAGAPSNHPPFGRLRQRRLFSLAFAVKALPPPLFVSFASLPEALEAMPAVYRDGIRNVMQPLVAQGLPPVLSSGVVATLFGVSTTFIRAIANNPARHYREFTIRKGKKLRKISAPKVALKLIQSWIGTHLSHSVVLSNCVLGFVPGHNGVIEAAAKHCSAKWVYSLDLRDFFPSIDSNRVIQSLLKLGYPESASILIAQLCTLGGALPQGSPASPVLSNLAFIQTDFELSAIAEEFDVRYTRYADDIVFSGEGELPADLQTRVRDCLDKHAWQIAPEKEKVVKLPNRLKVHGLLVHGSEPRLTKGYRNRIRAYRHLVLAGKVVAEDQAKIAGHISYAQQVESASGSQMVPS